MKDELYHERLRAMNQRLLAKFDGFIGYDLTQKQNRDFQQWKERQRKCEEESRRKQPFIIMSIKPPSASDMFNKEQKYFDKWIQEQKKKGELFKIKTYGKK
jgi:hypothetical protein